MCSYNASFVCSLVFAIVDVIHSLSIVVFYSYQQFLHRYCTYSHGILSCEYFLFKSNHSMRVKIGIPEGLICLGLSILLIYALYKRYGMLVWAWLIKPVGVIIINLYFVSVWLIERGRYYHSYDAEEEVEQELLFIYFGAANIAIQVIFGLWFCCSVGTFSWQSRKLQRHQMYSSSETKKTMEKSFQLERM